MKKVVIIGGGFAGLAALRKFSRYRNDLYCTLLDKKKTFDFLPALPDIISNTIDSHNLTTDLESFAHAHFCAFTAGRVVNVNFAKKVIYTENGQLSYDFLLIASGAETNFYGNKLIENNSFRFDSVYDATALTQALSDPTITTVMVAGGGYTGVEVATHIWRLCKKKKWQKKIIIVERASSILGPLPVWMKDYVLKNIHQLGIDVFTGTTIDSCHSGEVHLSNQQSFEKTILIWSAGTRTADYVFHLDVPKTPQGRLVVDEHLRVQGDCFAAGDVAHFTLGDSPLRMGVQFAISAGEHVAGNIIRSAQKKPLKKYNPADLGYVVPLANRRSCGIILGMPSRGLLPTLLHYFFCIYRSQTQANAWAIIRGLFLKKRQRGSI